MKSPLEARPDTNFDSDHTHASPRSSDALVPGKIDNADTWGFVPALFRTSKERLPAPWEDRFGPLREGSVDELVVFGQIGQSIDGRIATATGHSKYINGPAGLAHLHRLRALADAVVIGVGTAIADDPLLTVRNVAGPSPVRIVLDPTGRLPASARLLGEDGIRRIVMTAEGVTPKLHPSIEILNLRSSSGAIAPTTILYALAGCGFRRILIEGGANTVSRFIAAGCLDRLHVVVAPIIIGAGQSGVTLAPIDHVGEALRSPMRAHILGEEVLFDCDLTAQRVAVGRAKKST
jgi:diaminohydroxyphosphoribosylaminopyrimidine deaminase / 5-amino-6-(5-phosphoribosylamino)uracil reductase